MLRIALLAHATAHLAAQGFAPGDEASYLAAFQTLIADSYSAVDTAPAALRAACASKGPAFTGEPLDYPTQTLAGDASAAQAQAACGGGTVCIVPAGSTLRMESSLDVA